MDRVCGLNDKRLGRVLKDRWACSEAYGTFQVVLQRLTSVVFRMLLACCCLVIRYGKI
jgi:hypothetical protein